MASSGQRYITFPVSFKITAVIEEVLWSIRGSYQTIWSFPLTNVKWRSVTWPYTMTTPYWSDFVPNSTFYRILSGFHRTFATGVACRQGTLTPPDTWSRPFGTCICSTCWDQSFSELVVILPDYALRISLGTFSVFNHSQKCDPTRRKSCRTHSFVSKKHFVYISEHLFCSIRQLTCLHHMQRTISTL